MDTNISIIIYNAPAMQLMYISGSLPLAIIDKFNAYFHIVSATFDQNSSRKAGLVSLLLLIRTPATSGYIFFNK